MNIKLYIGKWFVAIRIGTLFLGVGKPSADLRSLVDRTQPHRGI